MHHQICIACNWNPFSRKDKSISLHSIHSTTERHFGKLVRKFAIPAYLQKFYDRITSFSSRKGISFMWRLCRPSPEISSSPLVRGLWKSGKHSWLRWCHLKAKILPQHEHNPLQFSFLNRCCFLRRKMEGGLSQNGFPQVKHVKFAYESEYLVLFLSHAASSILCDADFVGSWRRYEDSALKMNYFILFTCGWFEVWEILFEYAHLAKSFKRSIGIGWDVPR